VPAMAAMLRAPRALSRIASIRTLPSSSLVGTRRHFAADPDDEEVPKWLARYPPRFFDFKAFREALKETKESVSEAELREIRREYAQPPPEGWTVLTFLERMNFGDNAEDIANLFERWEDFISMSAKDITRITDITLRQRRQLNRYITLFNHGLWPKAVAEDNFAHNFAGEKLENEGKPWSKQDDEDLLELAKVYDVNFGDPWIYLSWELQRRETEVRDRYIEIKVKPRELSTVHEFAITKSSRPLHMHRKFRMLPPDLYVVPSEANFPLAPKKFNVPAAFEKYRQADIF